MAGKIDTIVYGGRLSGIVAAALLAERGMRVLLLNDERETVRKEKGYRLDLQMLPLGDIPVSPAVTGFLGRIGIDLSDRARFAAAAPLFQVVTDAYRLDISGAAEELKEELSLEFPQDTPHFLDFAAERDRGRRAFLALEGKTEALFPPHGKFPKLAWKIKGKGKGQETVRGAFAAGSGEGKMSPAFREIIDLCLRFSTPLYSKPEAVPFRTLLSGRLEGCTPMGGMSGFKALLLEKARKVGVEIAPAGKLGEIAFDGKRFKSLKYDKERAAARAFVFNARPAGLPDLLPQSFFTKNYRRGLAAQKRYGRWQTVFIGIDAERVPVGMGNALILAAGEEAPLLVRMNPAEDRDAAPAGRRLLKVSRAVEGEPPAPGSDAAKAFEASVLERINALIPYLGDKTEILSPPADSAPSADDDLLAGTLLTPPGMGFVSPLTPYRNLFLSGREIFPLLGIEGDFLAGELAAGLVTKELTEKER